VWFVHCHNEPGDGEPRRERDRRTDRDAHGHAVPDTVTHGVALADACSHGHADPDP
jgi:hypothetical protein